MVGIACGHSHTLAMTRQGRVLAWVSVRVVHVARHVFRVHHAPRPLQGKNANHQLGTGSDEPNALPAMLSFFVPTFDRVSISGFVAVNGRHR